MIHVLTVPCSDKRQRSVKLKYYCSWFRSSRLVPPSTLLLREPPRPVEWPVELTLYSASGISSLAKGEHHRIPGWSPLSRPHRAIKTLTVYTTSKPTIPLPVIESHRGRVPRVEPTHSHRLLWSHADKGGVVPTTRRRKQRTYDVQTFARLTTRRRPPGSAPQHVPSLVNQPDCPS